MKDEYDISDGLSEPITKEEEEEQERCMKLAIEEMEYIKKHEQEFWRKVRDGEI
jgi:hypothetical protein